MSESSVRSKIKKGDAFAAFFILLLALTMLLVLPSSSDTVNIKCGERVLTRKLHEDCRLQLENNGISLTVVIEDGCVYVDECTCPDKLCEKTGKIKNGCIVCLPAQVMITLGETEADIVAG